MPWGVKSVLRHWFFKDTCTFQISRFHKSVLINHKKVLFITFTIICLQDIKQILLEHNGGEIIIEEMNSGLLSHRNRIQAVRVLVSYVIETFGDRYVHN